MQYTNTQRVEMLCKIELSLKCRSRNGKRKEIGRNVWSNLQSADLDGGAEVEEAPRDDDVVVAAHQAGHHRAAVAHTLQARVDLVQETLVHMASVLSDVRMSGGTL